jgi:8-oxo-dGTP diphosphatase
MINVTCAIIERHGMVLAVLRAEGRHLAGYWEFPGGKIHPGESPQECVVREVNEELAILVSPASILLPVEHNYPEKSIRLYPVICTLEGGELELREHTDARWIWPEDLKLLKFCPADVHVIRDYLNQLP